MVVFFQTLLFLFLIVLSLFMILIILLQRGKGGGLVGAFGGMGGQSAFGIKSSDVFLRITVVSAIIWFVICIGGRYLLEMQTKSSLVEEKDLPAAVATDSDSLTAPEANNPVSDGTTETAVPISVAPESVVPESSNDATEINAPVVNDSTETAPAEVVPNP